jgi:hypothetical protein
MGMRFTSLTVYLHDIDYSVVLLNLFTPLGFVTIGPHEPWKTSYSLHVTNIGNGISW